MENTSQLHEIAETLGLKSVITTLSYIEDRVNQKNTELIIPLVGEFSAGKTSLLNALVNAKLETAVKPTTSVIFEIRFGNKEQKAVIIFDNGDTSEITDIESIKNDELKNVSCIKIFDTSVKIPVSTVLVDTPGLSSLNPTHQKALVDYLPFADIVLLVIDIEQGGLNASTLRFIKMAELAKKRIYIVLTKCDTKSKTDIVGVKQNIQKNLQLPVEQIICVSAKKGDIDELLALIDTIQKDKNRIIEEITLLRINNLKNEMIAFIDDLLDSAALSSEDIDKKIAGTKHEMEEIRKNIDSLISELERSINAIKDEQLNDFARRIEYDLEANMSSLSNEGADAKQEVSTQIRNTANIFFANFKVNVLKKLGVLARENRQKSGSRISPLAASLETFDMSNYKQDDFSYNFNLEVPEAQTINDGIAAGGNTLLNIGTIVFPVISPVIATAKAGVEATDALQKLANLFTQEKLVKPQRKRRIENYLNASLKPEFEMQLQNIGNSIVISIQNTLNQAVEEKINEMNCAFETLRTEKETLKTEFAQRMDILREYKKILEVQ
jgi:GTPase SAR1 family protein